MIFYQDIFVLSLRGGQKFLLEDETRIKLWELFTRPQSCFLYWWPIRSWAKFIFIFIMSEGKKLKPSIFNWALFCSFLVSSWERFANRVAAKASSHLLRNDSWTAPFVITREDFLFGNQSFFRKTKQNSYDSRKICLLCIRTDHAERRTRRWKTIKFTYFSSNTFTNTQKEKVVFYPNDFIQTKKS